MTIIDSIIMPFCSGVLGGMIAGTLIFFKRMENLPTKEQMRKLNETLNALNKIASK